MPRTQNLNRIAMEKLVRLGKFSNLFDKEDVFAYYRVFGKILKGSTQYLIPINTQYKQIIKETGRIGYKDLPILYQVLATSGKNFGIHLGGSITSAQIDNALSLGDKYKFILYDLSDDRFRIVGYDGLTKLMQSKSGTTTFTVSDIFQEE